MKVLIAGTRTFNNKNKMELELQNFLGSVLSLITEVVSGHSGQADLGGERWAKARKIKVQKFEANWVRFGKVAGPIRNSEIAEYMDTGDKAIIFWDGISKGSADMAIKAIKKLGEENVLVVRYSEGP